MGKDKDGGALRGGMSMPLSTDTRRVPASIPAGKDAALLEGVLARPEDSPDTTAEADVTAMLVVRLRRWHNQHDCPGSGSECTSPWHGRDLALLRDILMKLGLPGDTSMIEAGIALVDGGQACPS